MSAFELAWNLLKQQYYKAGEEKEEEKFKPLPSRTEEGKKQHPSSPTYGVKTPDRTRKPTESMRTGAERPFPGAPGTSSEDMNEFMRVGNPTYED